MRRIVQAGRCITTKNKKKIGFNNFLLFASIIREQNKYISS